MAKHDSKPQISMSTDDINAHLEKVRQRWQLIGISEAAVGREIIKEFSNVIGMQLAIDCLLQLSASDPKAYITAYNSLLEYALPKNTRKDGELAKGLQISFNMPQELPPSSHDTGKVTSQPLQHQREPIAIYISEKPSQE